MKKLVLVLLLSGCSETLPDVGGALTQVRDSALEVQEAYNYAKETAAALESVYTQVCVPPLLPQLLEPCAETRKALDQVQDARGRSFEALATAFEGINAAIEVYNKVNDEVGQ